MSDELFVGMDEGNTTLGYVERADCARLFCAEALAVCAIVVVDGIAALVNASAESGAVCAFCGFSSWSGEVPSDGDSDIVSLKLRSEESGRKEVHIC